MHNPQRNAKFLLELQKNTAAQNQKNLNTPQNSKFITNFSPNTSNNNVTLVQTPNIQTRSLQYNTDSQSLATTPQQNGLGTNYVLNGPILGQNNGQNFGRAGNPVYHLAFNDPRQQSPQPLRQFPSALPLQIPSQSQYVQLAGANNHPQDQRGKKMTYVTNITNVNLAKQLQQRPMIFNSNLSQWLPLFSINAI